jgi:hypothetical protein
MAGVFQSALEWGWVVSEWLVCFEWQDNLSSQLWRNGWLVLAKSKEAAIKRGLRELDGLVARVSNRNKCRLAIVVVSQKAQLWPEADGGGL